MIIAKGSIADGKYIATADAYDVMKDEEPRLVNSIFASANNPEDFAKIFDKEHPSIIAVNVRITKR